MRFLLASFVAALTVADESCDQKEQVSMLQTKDRSGLSKEPDLIKVVSKASHFFGDDAQVEQFLDGVKIAVKSMKEADGKEVLLQRASQSKQMQELIGRFQALPTKEREKLVTAGGSILDKLPASQRTALVQQVSHALDEGVSKKTQTTTEKTANGKTTVTENEDTGYRHRHYHGKYGTESASRGKRGGHEHRHSYRHNGQGGNARTSTASKGLTGHEHGHSTSHTLAGGRTETNTATRSKMKNGDVHTHEHEHEHDVDDSTRTETRSRSNDNVHEHKHHHNERNGNSQTDSTTWDHGEKTWHNGHDHDVATGHWVSHDKHGVVSWNWDWLLGDDDWDDDHHDD